MVFLDYWKNLSSRHMCLTFYKLTNLGGWTDGFFVGKTITPEFTPMKRFMVRPGAKDLVIIQCGLRCGNTFFFLPPFS